MRHIYGLAAASVLAVSVAAAEAVAPATPAAPAGASAQWQTQNLKFSYSGFTTYYTCDGLEDKVREILIAFGARKDAKVRATGCNFGSNQPSRFAWVDAKFSSLSPVTTSAPTSGASADTVSGVWVPVEMSPNRPSYMGAGDCELMEQLREVLPKGFTLRNVKYYASCTPHQVSLGSYSVKVEALKPASAAVK